MFVCDRQTDRQTNRQTDRLTDRQTNRRTPDYHIRMGETFYLIEKITSPTHYANFASLICSVRRGIINFFTTKSIPLSQRIH